MEEEGQAFSLSTDTELAVASMLKQVGSSDPDKSAENCAFISFDFMEEVLHGSVWRLTTNDVVKLRTAASRRNAGDTLLKMKPFEKYWHCDPQGEREHTLVRLRKRIMDGIRKFGLHLPSGRCVAGFEGSVFFNSTLRERSGCQTINARWSQDNDTRDFQGDVDENITLSSRSLSPVLADMWM